MLRSRASDPGPMGRKLALTRLHTMKLVKRLTTLPGRVFGNGPEDVQGEVAKLRWFQQIDLGNGIVTPGAEHSLGKLEILGMPEDLKGWSVLDVGAWDGFFSFEAERRGARPVLATDHFCWGGGGWGTRAAPLRLDRKSTRLNSSHEWISYAVFCLKKKKR